jgi:hypothetical protein
MTVWRGWLSRLRSSAGLPAWLDADPLPFVLAGLCLMVYLPAITWGIPHATAPDRVHAWGNDDQVPLAPLAEMYNTFVRADPNRNVAYPWFHYFLVACTYAPYLAYLLVTGGLEPKGGVYPFGFRDPVEAFVHLSWIGRAVSLALALAAVLATYDAGKQLWNRTAGTVAALATAFMFPMAYYARLGNLDAPVLGWTCLGVAVAARWIRYGPSFSRAVWFGLFVALAVSTKEQAAGSFVLLAPSIVFLSRGAPDAPRPVSWRDFLAAPVTSALSFAIAYVLAEGIPFDWDRYVQHMTKNVSVGTNLAGIYNRHPPTIEGYSAQSLDLFNHLIDVMSWPLLLVSCLGVLVAIRRDRRSLLLVVSSLGFFLMLLPVRFSRIHYLLAVAVPLNLFAGYAVSTWLRGNRLVRPLAATAIVAIIGYLLLQTVDVTQQMIQDSRYAAGQWLDVQMRPGDRLLYFGAPLKIPSLRADVRSVSVEQRRFARSTILETRPEFILAMPEDTDENRLRVEWRQGPHSIYNTYLPDDVHDHLTNESLGYRLVAQYQTPRFLSWLDRPFLSYATVNPPIQIFARLDRAAGLPRQLAWPTAPHYPRLRRVNEPPPVAAARDDHVAETR